MHLTLANPSLVHVVIGTGCLVHVPIAGASAYCYCMGLLVLAAGRPGGGAAIPKCVRVTSWGYT